MKNDIVLTGAAKIAQEFGLTPRQVYGLRESGKAPIRYVHGLGLTASREQLRNYLHGQHPQENLQEERR